MRRSLALATVLIMGCEPGTVAIDGTPDGDGDGLGGTVEIGVEGVRDVPLNGSVAYLGSGGGPGGGQAPLREAESRLWFAYGQDYPTDLELLSGELWEGRCLWSGTWTAESVRSSDPRILKAELVSGRLSAEVVAPGEVTLEIEGVFDGGCEWWGELYGRQPMRRTVEVTIFEPTGAVLEIPRECREEGVEQPPLLIAEAPMHHRVLTRVLGPDGEPSPVHNASELRPVSLSLSLPDGMSVTPPAAGEGFDQTVFQGAGQVSLDTPFGPAGVVDVTTPDRIDEMELGFGIPYGGGRGDIALEDGAAYRWSDIFVFDERFVFPMASDPVVDGRRACAPASADWFTLEVSPDQPAYEEPFFWTMGELRTFGLGTIIDHTGETSFSLEAPELNGGAGFRQDLRVSFAE